MMYVKSTPMFNLMLKMNAKNKIRLCCNDLVCEAMCICSSRMHCTDLNTNMSYCHWATRYPCNINNSNNNEKTKMLMIEVVIYKKCNNL